MFEAAEVGRSLSKEEYKKAEPEAHTRLLNLQMKLRQSGKALIIIVSGVEGAATCGGSGVTCHAKAT